MAMRIAACVWVLLVAVLSAQSGGGNGGKELFEKRCGGCHALDRDKEGPRLGGVYGKAAASRDSFLYSEALKKSKIVWSAETLDRWLTDPDALVPNNDMSFRVENADERQKIIEFLKQVSMAH
jgi:cytochrome c